MEIITSKDNKNVKEWLKLKQKKYRDLNNEFLISGSHLVNEAIRNAMDITLISLNEMDTNLPYYIVSESVMSALSTEVTIPKIMGVVKKKKERDIVGNVILLDNLQDPGNLGTIIRSSVAFDIDTIILGDGCVDLYNEKVIRSTEGLIFGTNIIKANLEEIIEKLKQDNYQIIGTKLDKGIKLKELSKTDKFGIVIGNEGKGISDDIMSLCDSFVYIPMTPYCESLNASVAASIIMYEMSDL